MQKRPPPSHTATRRPLERGLDPALSSEGMLARVLPSRPTAKERGASPDERPRLVAFFSSLCFFIRSVVYPFGRRTWATFAAKQPRFDTRQSRLHRRNPAGGFAVSRAAVMSALCQQQTSAHRP